ncbi:hypothetical protein CI238_13367 [Colletotrichum incanum]|uniref:DNA/RNA-binding domain-containing protein n=1 Tax=Colletotrichum incanum TaxID=1573173 RepID=A0A167DLU3_COLIC|nr:hypothetical protein CI238_13367 [Colletotrichum incanum]
MSFTEACNVACSSAPMETSEGERTLQSPQDDDRLILGLLNRLNIQTIGHIDKYAATEEPQGSSVYIRHLLSLLKPGDNTDPESVQFRKMDHSVEILSKKEELIANLTAKYEKLNRTEYDCQTRLRSEEIPELADEQMQGFMAQQEKLLREHYDFFLTSQHSLASKLIQNLPITFAMPSRLWNHGIQEFLDLLRGNLPASMKHMLSFIYLTYPMMLSLYELYKEAPTFKSIWIECLGDLARYRMAIEDDDPRVREKWKSVSRLWYTMASDEAPKTGRLYHHLAILAQPNALEQLFYYAKSLCVSIPFLDSRENIMTLFKPYIDDSPIRLEGIDAAFVRTHAILFSGENYDRLEHSVNEFVGGLDEHIKTSNESDKTRWLASGCQMSIALACAMLEYGSASNLIVRSIDVDKKGGEQLDDPETFLASQKFLDAIKFAAQTHNVILRRVNDPNVYPYLHVTLSFLHHISKFPMAMKHIGAKTPWKLISLMLNGLLEECTSVDRIESEAFPRLDEKTPMPLTEDFAQRGLLWLNKYYPDDWFAGTNVTNAKYELKERICRCLWLGCRLASANEWLTYDKSMRKFGVSHNYLSMPLLNNPGVEQDGALWWL